MVPERTDEFYESCLQNHVCFLVKYVEILGTSSRLIRKHFTFIKAV